MANGALDEPSLDPSLLPLLFLIRDHPVLLIQFVDDSPAFPTRGHRAACDARRRQSRIGWIAQLLAMPPGLKMALLPLWEFDRRLEGGNVFE